MIKKLENGEKPSSEDYFRKGKVDMGSRGGKRS